MPQERLSMRKIREVLRLKWECKLPHRAIARSCSISHSTVGEYVQRAQAAGLSWPLPQDLDDDALFRRLYPDSERSPRSSGRIYQLGEGENAPGNSSRNLELTQASRR